MRSAHGLELAPACTALSTTPSTYIWSIAATDEGNLYAAAGSPARVYRITPDGKSTVIFEPQELQVQALAVDKSGVIYAATNPDGKVYKIDDHAASPSLGSSGRDKKSTDKPTADALRSSSVYSSLAPNTYGTWSSTTAATSTWLRGIAVRYSGSLRRASIRFSLKATKPTSG